LARDVSAPAGRRFLARAQTVQQLHAKYNPMSDLILILTTMPDDGRADALARTLVDERLAACVNVHGPMMSTYRWKGAVERDAERQVVIKTARDRRAAVEARVRELHPYDLPEFVVIDAAGSEAYAAWVTGETSGSRSG
jgi:periplasmic divalent cation tolerance protein